jgi:hypothetical protein
MAPEGSPDDEDSRRSTNLVLLLVAVAVVVAGIWLVNSMVETRKLQECMESGRPNCRPIGTERQTW